MTNLLQARDDYLHSPGTDSKWRESYYFGFYDERGRAGLTYISLSPNQHSVVHWVTLVGLPGGRNLVYLQSDPLPSFDDAALETGALRYQCQEPFQHWRLQFGADCLALAREQEMSSALVRARSLAVPADHSPVRFDLDFRACMPAYDFPSGALDFLGGKQRHFEQMGRVTGQMHIGDEESVFAGWGSRDRSWGTRDWLGHEGYSWINLQWGDDVAVGVIVAIVAGRELSCGFVYQEGSFQPVSSASLEASRDPNDLHLLEGRLHVQTDQQQSFVIDLAPDTFYHAILAREGPYQHHDCATLVTGQHGAQVGRGIVEYAKREQVSPLTSGDSLW